MNVSEAECQAARPRVEVVRQGNGAFVPLGTRPPV